MHGTPVPLRLPEQACPKKGNGCQPLLSDHLHIALQCSEIQMQLFATLAQSADRPWWHRIRCV